MDIKKICNLPTIFGRAFINTILHDGIEHAGYLAFLLMLGIFPFFVFFTTMIGTLSDAFSIPVVGTLTDIILNSSWAHFIDALKPRIIEITSLPPQSFLTIVTISTIFSASSIFEALRTTLNKACNVSNPPAYISRRLLSILEFLLVTIMVAVGTDHLNFYPYNMANYARIYEYPK